MLTQRLIPAGSQARQGSLPTQGKLLAMPEARRLSPLPTHALLYPPPFLLGPLYRNEALPGSKINIVFMATLPLVSCCSRGRLAVWESGACVAGVRSHPLGHLCLPAQLQGPSRSPGSHRSSDSLVQQSSPSAQPSPAPAPFLGLLHPQAGAPGRPVKGAQGTGMGVESLSGLGRHSRPDSSSCCQWPC